MRPAFTTIEAAPVTGAPRKKHRSPSDRTRDTRRVQRRIDARVAERAGLWAEGNGRDDFTIAKQDGTPSAEKGALAYEHHETRGSLAGLHVTKRRASASDLTLDIDLEVMDPRP